MDTLLAKPDRLFGLMVLVAFTAVAVWEWRRPLMPTTAQLERRWLANFGLFVVNHAAGYLIAPAVALMGTALAARPLVGDGLLAEVGLWPQVLAGFVALDLLRWASHWALHRWPLLWQVHQVHHSDAEFDCTVGVRFHPLEAVLYAGLTALAVLTLGLRPAAVVLIELVFIAHNFFCHANAALPRWLEQALRPLVITPELHRVHHARDPSDAGHNFGTVLSCWDRLAGTWRAGPAATAAAPQFGLAELPATPALSLPQLLWLPLRRLTGRPTVD